MENCVNDYEEAWLLFHQNLSKSHMLSYLAKFPENPQAAPSLEKYLECNIPTGPTSNSNFSALDENFQKLVETYLETQQDIDLKKTIDKQLADERFQIMELKSKVDTLSETNFKWNIDLDSDDKFLQEMEEESRILALQIAEARQKNEELNRKINQFDNRSSPLLNESESPALLAANKELEELKELMVGIQHLKSIHGAEVSKEDDGSLVISFFIDNNSIEIVLSPQKDLKGIEVKNSSLLLDTTKILEECSSFPPPQNLKQAIQSLVASVHSIKYLEDHLQQLRKEVILAYDPLTHTVSITLANGLVALLSISSNYYFAPASLVITSLRGLGGWKTTRVDQIRTDANNMSFSNLLEFYNYLKSFK